MTLLRRSLLLPVLFAAGCADTTRPAMGDANSVIVVAADSLWAEVGDTVLTALQPEIFAVRDEPTFHLTHMSPGSENWPELRRFRQLLVIGRPDDPWVAEALDAGGETVTDPPAILEIDRVWARGQRVTALVLPESDPSGVVRESVDSLAALLDARYQGWARNRMYLSGRDSALIDTLQAEGGFGVDIPQVYRWRRASDSTFLFLNDNPDASRLVRWLTVTWREAPAVPITEEAVLEWRDSIASQYYDWGQVTGRDRVESRRIEQPGSGGLAVRGVWSTSDEFPQAGPFISYAVDCPDQNRRYLLDGWLYAPTMDKYQYMIQLETLLSSFTCGGPGERDATD